MSTVTLVGGPADGRSFDVPDTMHVLEVPVEGDASMRSYFRTHVDLMPFEMQWQLENRPRPARYERVRNGRFVYSALLRRVGDGR